MSKYLVPLAIGATSLLALWAFLMNEKMFVVIIIWSSILFALLLIGLARRIYHAMRGANQTTKPSIENHLIRGAMWYFIGCILLIVGVVFLHGLFAG